MTEAEIDEFCERCNHRVGRNPARCQEGASRGGFTLGFPKDWVKPAEAGFVAIAREAECPLCPRKRTCGEPAQRVRYVPLADFFSFLATE